jgi:hypothetical protein
MIDSAVLMQYLLELICWCRATVTSLVMIKPYSFVPQIDFFCMVHDLWPVGVRHRLLLHPGKTPIPFVPLAK